MPIIKEEREKLGKKREVEEEEVVVPHPFPFRDAAYFMAGAFAFTFFSALVIKNKWARRILYLECIVTLVSCLIYSYFAWQFTHDHFTLDQINLLRYIGWFITTPIMLVVLCFVLASNLSWHRQLDTILLYQVVGLDYVMLGCGILGELGIIPAIHAMILGFVPFLILFGLIYKAFIHQQKQVWMNQFVFLVYFILWTGYGLVYLLDPTTKSIITTLLDMTAKGVFAIGISTQFLLS